MSEGPRPSSPSSPGPHGTGGSPRRVLQIVDAVFYAIGTTLIATLVGVVLSFPLGAGWVGVKWALFVIGLFAFGIGAIQIRPTPAWRDEPRFSIEPDDETPFQAAIQRLPPLRGQLAPDERLSVGTRLFLGGVLMLATSFLMERALGVGVPTV